MANDGVLTCKDLLLIERTLNNTWGTDTAFSAARGVVKDDTLQCVIRNMTADFEVISDQTDKQFPGVKVSWLEDCRFTTKTCDTSCSAPASGVKIGAKCENVDITQCEQVQNFEIDEVDLYTTTVNFEEIVSRGMYQADRAIAEALNVVMLTDLDAAAGVNQNPDTVGGTVTPATIGNCTTMPPSLWANPIQYLSTTLELNNFTDPYILMGSQNSLFDTISQNRMSLGQPALTSGMTTWSGWDVCIDIRQFDTTISGNKVFFVNKGEFAVLNAYCYNPIAESKFRPGKGGEYTTFRMRSPILSEFYRRDWFHDVIYTVTCSNTGAGGCLKTTHNWEILTRYEIAQSPDDCDGFNRVLCFTCAAA